MKDKKTLEKLTQKQRDTFSILTMYIKDNGVISIRVLRDLVDKNISHIAILCRLKALQNKGYIVNKEGKFTPTPEGIKQHLMDMGDDTRLKVIRRK